ncbi:MAG: cytochrome c oxidase subunit 3 [Chloroflexota bacterium]
MSATTPAVQGGQRPLAQPKRISNGLLGMIFFLSSEAVIFSSLIFAYLYLRRVHPLWPPLVPGTHLQEKRLEIGYPFINTIILISSGVTQHFAHGAIRRGNMPRFIGLSIATILLGSWFVGGQIWEYKHLETAIDRDPFGGTFFTLTGLHGAHVTAGVILLIVLLVASLRGKFTQYRHFPIEAGTLYWHFVDAIWVVLFSLFYLL